MKILLSNDDGVQADGIRTLAGALCGDYEIGISAPDRERSAASRSLTLSKPLRVKQTKLSGLPGVQAYAVSGTPADCVRIGIGNLFGRPDMVVAGINHGGNLGTDTLYSGTVAAAHEAALLGIQAAAISCCGYPPEHFETAAAYARRAVAYLLEHPLPFGMLLNVNVPDLPPDEVRGIKFAPLCLEKYALNYVEKEDPLGVPYYWAPRTRLTEVAGEDVDTRWVKEGYTVFTPLRYDLTADELLEKMRQEDITGE